MTTRLPVVTVSQDGHGWRADCDACTWGLWQISRPVVDLEAIQHRRRCRRKDS